MINLVDEEETVKQGRQKTDFTNINCNRCHTSCLDFNSAIRESINGAWTGKWLCRKCYRSKWELDTYGPVKKCYNSTNICDICGKDLLRESEYPKKEFINGISTGKWLCNSCYGKNYRQRPGNINTLIKNMGDRRMGYQDPCSSNAKGDKFEELTNKWKEVQRLGVITDNYISPLDHTPDITGLIYQTKGKFYDYYNQIWLLGCKNEHNKDFDYLIFYCASKDGKIIERIYIFPKEEIMKKISITVTKNPSNRNGRCPNGGWYEKYRVKDEDIVRKVNELWNDNLMCNK